MLGSWKAAVKRMAISAFDRRPLVMHLAPGYRAVDPRLYYLQCDALIKAGCTIELVAHLSSPLEVDSRVRLHSLGEHRSTLAWRLVDRFQRVERPLRQLCVPKPLSFTIMASSSHCGGNGSGVCRDDQSSLTVVRITKDMPGNAAVFRRCSGLFLPALSVHSCGTPPAALTQPL